MSRQEKDKVQIVAVSVDNHEVTNKFIRSLKERYPGDYDFPFLEDKDHKVIDRYGIFNPDGRGWPHPAVFVIDPQGIVRWKFIEVNYKIRASNQQILQALKNIQ